MQEETKLKIETEFPKKFEWTDDDKIEGEITNYLINDWQEMFMAEAITRSTETGKTEIGLAVSLDHEDFQDETNELLGIAWFSSDKEMQKNRMTAIKQIILQWLEKRKEEMATELQRIDAALKAEEQPNITYDWFHCPKCGRDKAEHTEKLWNTHLTTRF